MKNIRLYVAPNYGTYDLGARSNSIYTILNKMDSYILEQEFAAKYLVVAEINRGDVALFFSFGDKESYLSFRAKYYNKEVCKTYKKKK